MFLHGYPLDHRMWDPVAPRLDLGRPPLLLDLPGYGAAEDTPAPSSLGGFAEFVRVRLDALATGPAVFVGHSFGGYVALELFRTDPQRFAGLVLTNTRSEPDSAEARAKRLELIGRLGQPGERLDVEATVRALVAPERWSEQGPVVQLVREIVSSATSFSLVATLRAIADRPDLTPVLGTIRVPSLVVWGEEDQLIPPAQTRGMVERIPGAEGAGIPGAGHLPSLEDPERFAEALGRLRPRLTTSH